MAVERAGVERETYLREAGIAPDLLDDMHGRISLDEYRRAVRAAYKVTDDPAFGLHLGERLAVSSFDVLGHLTEESSSLRDALLTAVRYSRFVSEGPRIELEEHAETAVFRIFLPEEDTPESRFVSEFSNVAVLRLMRSFVGAEAMPLRVFFTHRMPEHHAEYTRYFGGAERFLQPWTGLEIARAWLDEPSYARAGELRSYLLQRAELLLAKADQEVSVTQRVTRWIDAQADLARPTLEQVARDLGTSTRSLRRRLQEEHTQFSALIDTARALHARRMLRDPRTGIQDTAYALGFRTPSAFSRAFKRWTGMGPKAFRKAQARDAR